MKNKKLLVLKWKKETSKDAEFQQYWSKKTGWIKKNLPKTYWKILKVKGN